MIEKRIPNGRILDVGCSSGYFLDVMQGWDRHGIEFSGAFAEKAIEKHGDKIHTGTLDDYRQSSSFFDVITLQDVLDHMLCPPDALEKCHALLKPGGLIVIKVHNISCLYAKLTGKYFHAIVPPYHISYFNKKSLSTVLTKGGFEVLDSRFIAHVLFLKTIPYRLARGDSQGLFFRLYKMLNRSSVGNIRIKKNLHDIVTVIARKVSV